VTVKPRDRIGAWLGVTGDSKPQVYFFLYESSQIASVPYLLELFLSSGIATLGLVLDSPAVVIGAMLISPLMGPILATGLALAASDVYLGLKCLINLTVSVTAAVLFSALLVWLLPFHAATAEIVARTKPNLLDLGVALFSGLAGALVVSRRAGGSGAAMPGVAVAVALMPPLCTVGFGLGSGADWVVMSGAGLLFFTNLSAIVACAFLVFFLVGMDASEVRAQIGTTELQQAADDWLYGLLKPTVLHRSFGRVGLLRWRVAMMIVTLVIVYVPLSRSFRQVRDEAVGRAAVAEALHALGPADAVLSQQLDLLPDRVLVHLVVTSDIAPANIVAAERLVIARTGKPATITVRQVASQDELALLRERLAAPPPVPAAVPAPPTIDALRADFVARLTVPITESWPAALAELAGYDLELTSDDVLVRIRYVAKKAIDPDVASVLARVLQTRVGTDRLRVVLERVPAPPPRAPRPGAES